MPTPANPPPTTTRPCLLDLTRAERAALLASWGEPAYRADQIAVWLYRQFADGADAMRNLPAPLRRRLAEETTINPLQPRTSLDSADGEARKALFSLSDGESIEAVLMRYRRRQTVCLSTQAGCAMGCPFCATGQMGLHRNLSAGEIVAQVLHFARALKAEDLAVTNVVFMGMGEPLANYEQTWRAIRLLNSPDGFNLGARHMTISTVGIVPGIQRMSREPEQVSLAVSLHAATDELRSRLVPVNRRHPLADLMEALREYIRATRRRVTFEYALIQDVNDATEHAERLAALLRGLLCHVNLIPLNPIPDSPWQGSAPRRAEAFRDRLAAAGIPTTMRLRRGVDIAAGCGQLRADAEARPVQPPRSST
jgi:23S rRNA (adenine2503-C2)-methyltransferase